MRTLRHWWDSLSETGVRYVTTQDEKKALRLVNRILVIAFLIVLLQAFLFYRQGLAYVVRVNFAILATYAGCLILTALGYFRLSRYLFILTVLLGVAHHHVYFGFASGFWLQLLALCQGIFVVFPGVRLRILGPLALLLTCAVSAGVFVTVSQPALFSGMTPALAQNFLYTNVIRTPVLFFLVGFYLVYENRRTEGELRLAARQAAESAEARSFFLSNMSHELRTPMNAIKGFSEILLSRLDEIQEEKVRSQVEEYLEYIRQSASNLTSVIDDILDFANIETNRIQLRSTDFDLRRLCDDTLRTASFYGRRSPEIEICRDYDTKIPSLVRGDAARLGQVLLNLLSNAMKFTHEGKVELRVKLIESNADGYLVQFEVEDTGIGIPGEKLTHLFDSLAPVSRDTIVRYGGVGLGLAITKHLLTLQGGTISAMSSPGHGSLFSCVIPLEKPENAAGNSVMAKHDLHGRRILVAEDNAANQLLIRTILESWNCHVDIVENGLKALARVRKGNYDLVLMDIQMPFMDGIAATEHIRSLDDAARAQIPIVALTADVLGETRRRALSAGIYELVTKPINQAELYAVLRRVLGLKEEIL